MVIILKNKMNANRNVLSFTIFWPSLKLFHCKLQLKIKIRYFLLKMNNRHKMPLWPQIFYTQRLCYFWNAKHQKRMATTNHSISQKAYLYREVEMLLRIYLLCSNINSFMSGWACASEGRKNANMLCLQSSAMLCY